MNTNTNEKTESEKSVLDLINDAKKSIEKLTPEELQREISTKDITLIDIREPDESKNSGAISKSFNAPRGLLEFYADPKTPYHMPVFNKSNRLILYCASGGRSALACATLKEMGFRNIGHLEGGLKAWVEAGYQVVK
jgi:rhodanese-related sulfurtransferase